VKAPNIAQLKRKDTGHCSIQYQGATCSNRSSLLFTRTQPSTLLQLQSVWLRMCTCMST